MRSYATRNDINQLPQDVLAEKLPSPYQQQDASTQSVRRNVPDLKLLEATLDHYCVERPSPTDEGPHHLCLNIGYDNEPSRDVPLERGYIAHIHRIVEEKDEADQRRYPAQRWAMERTLGWLSKCRAILVRHEKKAPSPLPLVSRSACPVLATWGIAPGKEELATHYLRCLRGI